MKILVVGGGGREHAILKALSKKGRELFAAPGNGGISTLATCVPIAATDIGAIVDYCKKTAIDFVVVAPDDPLVLGMVDRLEEQNIPAFGPTKAAAEIEGSKAFSKTLMKKYNIPTADFEVFTNINQAFKYLDKKNKYPIVIKASGLALGKGVIIALNETEAKQAVIEILSGEAFGEAGKEIVIEEFIEGPEVSLLCFTDGNTIKPMVSAMDHKRALDGDKGLNTGGMGVIAKNPFYTEEIAKITEQTILYPTINAMKKEGREFKGVLYYGLMLTKDGVKVIEYNCRFGDPEAQVCLALLETDLLQIMQSTRNGTLHEIEVINKPGAAACVVIASGGYPQQYEKGKIINGLNNVDKDIDVFHCATIKKGDDFLSNGGRVLCVTAVANSLKEALNKVYIGVDSISFEHSFYRKDIGAKGI